MDHSILIASNTQKLLATTLHYFTTYLTHNYFSYAKFCVEIKNVDV